MINPGGVGNSGQARIRCDGIYVTYTTQGQQREFHFLRFYDDETVIAMPMLEIPPKYDGGTSGLCGGAASPKRRHRLDKARNV